MQQKWWLVAAGVVGVALAILLFPKPDSSELPDPDMTRANPLDFKADPQARNKGPRQVRVANREMRRPDVMRKDAERLAGRAHANDPEAVYSGRLSGPWTLVRRQLLSNGDADAKTWAEKVTPLVMDLRARRRDPEAAGWDDLRARQDALLTELRSNPDWLTIEGVEAQVERIDELFTTFDQEAELAKAKEEGTDAPAEGAPPAAPASAPKEGE